MNKEKKFSKAEFSDMVIKTSIDIIANEGHHNLSARKIAAKIGYTVGNLYNVFSCMEEVLMYVNSYTLDKLLAYMQDSLKSANQDDVYSKMYAISKAYLEFSKEYLNLWVLLFEYRLQEQSIITAQYKKKVQSIFGFVADTIYRNIEGGALDLMTFWACIHGIAILSSHGKFDLVYKASEEDLIKHAIEVFRGKAVTQA